MARYRGPKTKIAKRFNEPILGPCKALQKKKSKIVHHGKRPKKASGYALQLFQKQKVKYLYGLQEKPLRILFKKAAAQKDITGTVLMQCLESRLDNIVYRLALAPTRRAARQLVSHKHINVNGKPLNIPSYHVQVNDIICLTAASPLKKSIEGSLQPHAQQYNWLAWDSSSMQGKFVSVPMREDIPENIDEQSIVELYSK